MEAVPGTDGIFGEIKVDLLSKMPSRTLSSHKPVSLVPGRRSTSEVFNWVSKGPTKHAIGFPLLSRDQSHDRSMIRSLPFSDRLPYQNHQLPSTGLQPFLIR